MLTGDLIHLSDFPDVVVLSDVARLKRRMEREGDELSPHTRSLLEGYLSQYVITEPENRAACQAVLTSLARVEGPGRAFLIRGVYGAGKSHLLALASILAEHARAWPFFLRTHPEFAHLVSSFTASRQLLVIQVSLDEFRAESQALEDVIFDAIEAELALPKYRVFSPLADASHILGVVREYLTAAEKPRLDRLSGGSWEQLASESPSRAAEIAARLIRRRSLPISVRRSRGEAFARLWEILHANSFSGVALLLDELGLFLSSTKKRALDADAHFLQFLGQQAQRQPLWLICSIQKGVEDIGDIDSHTLRQIKDRFAAHTLSLAQLRSVIAAKVAVREDEQNFQARIDDISEPHGGSSLCFPRGGMAQLYPFNPLAFECLESLAATHLSQTRTLLQTVRAAAESATGGKPLLERPAWRLISSDELLSLLSPWLEPLPEAKRHFAARNFVLNQISRLPPDEQDLARALTDALALTSLAGFRWTVKELADSLAGSSVRPYPMENDTAFCANVRQTLEALRRWGAYLAVSRHAEEFQDVYFLDVSSDAPEILRRRLNEIADSFEPADERVVEAAISTCDGTSFPLAALTAAKSVGFEWNGLRRHASVEVRNLSALSSAALKNIAGLLENPKCREDAHLFIATPCASEPQRQHWLALSAGPSSSPGSSLAVAHLPVPVSQGLRQGLAEARDGDARFAPAVAAWIPRRPSPAELELLVENAAASLLLADPLLPRSKMGREVQSRLKEMAPSLRAQTRALLEKIYRSGEAVSSNGELAAGPDKLEMREGDAHARAAQGWPAPRGQPEGVPSGSPTWAATLEAIFSGALSRIFPLLPSIAPGARHLGRQQVAQIMATFVRPGWISAASAQPLEPLLSDYLEPLGMLRRTPAGLSLVFERQDLLQTVLSLFPPAENHDSPASQPAPRAYADIERALAKSDFGLTPELAELTIASMARLGHLVGLNSFLTPIAPEEIASPLSEQMPFVSLPVVLPEALGRKAASFASALFSWKPARRGPAQPGIERLDATAQSALWEKLRAWRRDALHETESLKQELSRLVQASGSSPSDWSESAALLDRMPAALDQIPESAASADGLRAFLASRVSADSVKFERLRQFLREDAPRIRECASLARDARMSLRPSSALAAKRMELLSDIAGGEALLTGSKELVRRCESFARTYARAYAAWHKSVHAPERYLPYVKMKQSIEHSCLECLHNIGVCGRQPLDLVEAILERRCAGAGLDSSLARSPVCGVCGLRLGGNLQLEPPGRIRAAIEQALGQALADLRDRCQSLREHLHGESSEPVKQGVENVLSCAERGDLKALLEAASPDVVDWLRRRISLKLVPRSLSGLRSILIERRMTKREAVEAFRAWLDPSGQLSDEDVVEFTESDTTGTEAIPDG
jgi:hypothetical protein